MHRMCSLFACAAFIVRGTERARDLRLDGTVPLLYIVSRVSRTVLESGLRSVVG
jgi:hypothetical protein